MFLAAPSVRDADIREDDGDLFRVADDLPPALRPAREGGPFR